MIQNKLISRRVSLLSGLQYGWYFSKRRLSPCSEGSSSDILQLGDVVVLKRQKPDGLENHYVHRIIGITSLNFITCGDNNKENDDLPVSAENFIGKVTHFERNGNIHKVWNGRFGMMRARVLHGRLYLIRVTKFFLRKPYRMVKKTGIVSKLWRPEIETIYFETQDGPLIKYVHKGRTVASCWTE